MLISPWTALSLVSGWDELPPVESALSMRSMSMRKAWVRKTRVNRFQMIADQLVSFLNSFSLAKASLSRIAACSLITGSRRVGELSYSLARAERALKRPSGFEGLM